MCLFIWKLLVLIFGTQFIFEKHTDSWPTNTGEANHETRYLRWKITSYSPLCIFYEEWQHGCLKTTFKWSESKDCSTSWFRGRIQKAVSEISTVSFKNLDNQRRWMVRTVKLNPQTSSKDLQHDLATDGVTVHRLTTQRTLHKEMLYGRVMRKKHFLSTCHRQSCLRYIWINQLHFGKSFCGLMKQSNEV